MRALFLNQATEVVRLSGARLEAAEQILAHTLRLANLSGELPSGSVSLKMLRLVDNRQRFIHLYEQLDRALTPLLDKPEALPDYQEAEILLQLAIEIENGLAERLSVEQRDRAQPMSVGGT